jgi:H+-transporting ATPase
LGLCALVLALGLHWLRFDREQLQTLAFLLIVFGNQATNYTNRERRRLWSSRPSRWVVLSSALDIGIASVLAIGGFAMAPLPALVVGGTLAAAAACAVLLDQLKLPVFARLGIS